MRLVARYAQACNLFHSPELPHKLDVLREHCEREGRNYDEIEKTVMFPFDLGRMGRRSTPRSRRLRGLAKLGLQEAHGIVPDVWKITRWS